MVREKVSGGREEGGGSTWLMWLSQFDCFWGFTEERLVKTHVMVLQGPPCEMESCFLWLVTGLRGRFLSEGGARNRPILRPILQGMLEEGRAWGQGVQAGG